MDLWSELDKISEKEQLNEMAVSRQEAINILNRHSSSLADHLAKCFLFPSSIYFNHWLDECSNYLYMCDNIHLKPNNKKPDIKFIETYLFDSFDNAEDSMMILNSIVVEYSKLHHDKITKDDGLNFVDLYEDVKSLASDYIHDKKQYSQDDYRALIKKCLDNYIN